MLQLVNMFGFVLDRPLIQHHLKLVLIDLDQTKLLFYRQRKEAETLLLHLCVSRCAAAGRAGVGPPL